MPKEMQIKPNVQKVGIRKEELSADIIKLVQDIKKTNSTEPTHIPKNFLEQLYLYKNSTDYRLYIYLNNEWKYIDLT